MAAAFRKLRSSEPLCVGTRNEGQEPGEQQNLGRWGQPLSRSGCLRGSTQVPAAMGSGASQTGLAPLHTVPSSREASLHLEVAESVRWQNWGGKRDQGLGLLTSFERDNTLQTGKFRGVQPELSEPSHHLL